MAGAYEVIKFKYDLMLLSFYNVCIYNIMKSPATLFGITYFQKKN